MGNRASVIIRQDDYRAIEIYSHWAGKNIINSLPKALKIAEDRYDQIAYFTRVIIQNILDDIADKNQSIGVGISVCGWCNNRGLYILDNETVFIDTSDKTVTCGNYCATFDCVIKFGVERLQNNMEYGR